MHPDLANLVVPMRRKRWFIVPIPCLGTHLKAQTSWTTQKRRKRHEHCNRRSVLSSRHSSEEKLSGSTRPSSIGGPRAGLNFSGLVGIPRCFKIFSITSSRNITAMIRRSPPHSGHINGSIPYCFQINLAPRSGPCTQRVRLGAAAASSRCRYPWHLRWYLLDATKTQSGPYFRRGRPVEANLMPPGMRHMLGQHGYEIHSAAQPQI